MNLNASQHIDIFPNITRSGSIILSGSTNKYSVPILSGGNTMNSIEQYFLDNPTREGIQYLILSGENGKRDFIIPGLIYDDITGTVLGFLHSYITNGSSVMFETPYNDDTKEYTFSGVTAEKDGNKYYLSIGSKSNSLITVSAGISEASFNLYKKVSTATETYLIKNMNQYGDYSIAAQRTIPNIIAIKEFFEELEQSPSALGVCLPVNFKTTYLYNFAETKKNIAQNTYIVPAAFVDVGGEKVFMTNVNGIATN